MVFVSTFAWCISIKERGNKLDSFCLRRALRRIVPGCLFFLLFSIAPTRQFAMACCAPLAPLEPVPSITCPRHVSWWRIPPPSTSCLPPPCLPDSPFPPPCATLVFTCGLRERRVLGASLPTLSNQQLPFSPPVSTSKSNALEKEDVISCTCFWNALLGSITSACP